MFFLFFSWDEMAAYDLPAMINFALKMSKSSRLHYIGHSQGTLIMFAHLAENPLFADKVRIPKLILHSKRSRHRIRIPKQSRHRIAYVYHIDYKPLSWI